MKNFVPFEKLSKKEQKKLNAAKRGSWGEINPVSRKSENKKAYSRKNPKVDPWDFCLQNFRNRLKSLRLYVNINVND